MKVMARARIALSMAAVRHPLVARLFAAVETFQWRVTLFFERRAERAWWRYINARSAQSHRVQNAETAKRLADRLAGAFVPLKGYPPERLWLRRLIFRVMVPGWVIERVTWRWYAVLWRWHRHPGRYEGCTSQRIAEWLDGHTEYARREAGDTEYTGWVALFAAEALPWAWPYEALLFSRDSSGYCDYSGETMAAAEAHLDRIDRAMVEAEPTCDICGEPMVEDDADWNGETGQHHSCEESDRENRLYDQARDDALEFPLTPNLTTYRDLFDMPEGLSPLDQRTADGDR